MKKIARGYVVDILESIVNDIDGMSVDATCNLLKDKEKSYLEKGYFDITVQIDCDYERVDLDLTGKRLENDKEYKQRLNEIEKEKATKAKRKEDEFKEYLKLKKKFEKLNDLGLVKK